MIPLVLELRALVIITISAMLMGSVGSCVVILVVAILILISAIVVLVFSTMAAIPGGRLTESPMRSG